MKTKMILGWILVGLGAIFLIGGLFVLIFATVQGSGDMALDAPSISPSLWVSIADRVMDFIIELLEVDWTPTRVGIFLIVIGLVFEGGGAYALLSKN
jgi:hypothetical protein